MFVLAADKNNTFETTKYFNTR